MGRRNSEGGIPEKWTVILRIAQISRDVTLSRLTKLEVGNLVSFLGDR